MPKQRPWALALVICMCIAVACNRGQSESAAVAAPGLATVAAYEGSGLRFELHGHDGPGLPALTVIGADGTDWTEHLTAPERSGDAVVVRLPGRSGLNRLAVENLDYAWTLPGTETGVSGVDAAVTGTVQYRDSRVRDLEWQLTEIGHLLIYHAKPLYRDEEAHWQRLLDWVLMSTGAELERPVVAWQFPDVVTLNKWYRGSMQIAGMWDRDVQRMVTHSSPSLFMHEMVLVHEFVHAVSPLTGPVWYEEGIAQLIHSRYEAEYWGKTQQHYYSVRTGLDKLQRLAQERPISVFETSRLHETLNPYFVGLSFWQFTERHHGEEGLQRLFATDVSGTRLRSELEGMFGKDLPLIWDDWNEYLRSPDLLADWEAGR